MRWKYQPEEWESFIREDWRKVEQQLRRRMLIVAVVALTVVVLGSMWVSALEVELLVLFVVAFGIPSGLFLGGLYFLSYTMQRDWYRNLRHLPPEVLILHDAVVFGGETYFNSDMKKAIRAFGVSVHTHMEPGSPGVLCFDRNYYLFRGHKEQVRVPIPTNQVDDAWYLVEYFR